MYMMQLSRLGWIALLSTTCAESGMRRAVQKKPIGYEYEMGRGEPAGRAVIENSGRIEEFTGPVRRMSKGERSHYLEADHTNFAMEPRSHKPANADDKAKRKKAGKKIKPKAKSGGQKETNLEGNDDPTSLEKHLFNLDDQSSSHATLTTEVHGSTQDKDTAETTKTETKPNKTKQKKIKKKKAAKIIDPHVPYKVFCRAPNPINGAWEDCYLAEPASFRELDSSTTGEAPAILEQSSGMIQAPRPFSMASQQCLDVAGHGNWSTPAARFDTKSLGSNSRYAGTDFYLGPPLKVNQEASGIIRLPHAREHTSGRGACNDCPEFNWSPAESAKGCPEWRWLEKNEVQSCLTGSWIALWGDSTMRITFSALVDFLGDGIQDDRFPTHDFTYHGHNARFDHCREGRCFQAVHFPKHDILLTFDFVSRIKDWPDLWETMGYYADTETFPELVMTKKRPDLVLLNSGPWEHYWRGTKYNHPWDGDLKYMERFNQFITDHFVYQNETTATTDLLILRNTACPQQSQCEGTKESCMSAMGNIHGMQTKVIREINEKHPAARVRYLDGLFAYTVPEGYSCLNETGFHLPGVITDVRLNHALHAVCH